jgi:hypothetical protein
VGYQGYQVRQGLARTRPGLDQQVVAGLDCPGHLPGHFMLPTPALPAHAGNGAVEQLDDELLAGRACGFASHEISHC